MPYVYSTPEREKDTYALPDVWVAKLTAEEIAESLEEEIFSRRERFPLAHMNSVQRADLIASIVEEESVVGGWCWCYCSPGCLPDSDFFGPFQSYADAVADAAADAQAQEEA